MCEYILKRIMKNEDNPVQFQANEMRNVGAGRNMNLMENKYVNIACLSVALGEKNPVIEKARLQER